MPEAVAAPAGVSSVTVSAALSRASARLAEAGVDTPALDASILLAFVLGVGRERLVLDASQSVDGSALERFNGLIARRAAREPVAYITGVREFRRVALGVDRRVLIPRPETELLVEVGLGLRAGARVVDVGTGSGAVALALKDERPDLSVVGVDVDGGALEVARGNAARLGLDVAFLQADLLGKGEVAGGWDAVLANLPYVADGSPLPPEVSLYEPGSALFAGADGLDVIRRFTGMVSDAPLVALEIGFDQAPAVAALLADAGFASVERLRDLAGHERVIVGRR